MTPEEKRNSLRASGVRPPRKRVLSESENQNKDLEDLMLPLMDEAVSVYGSVRMFGSFSFFVVMIVVFFCHCSCFCYSCCLCCC